MFCCVADLDVDIECRCENSGGAEEIFLFGHVGDFSVRLEDVR